MSGTVTRLVNGIADGSLPTAADPALEALYQEMRTIAAHLAARSSSVLLQPTELVHEAFLKRFRPGCSPWHNRAHFFGSAARAMQQVIVDRYRTARVQQRAATPSGEVDSPLATIDTLALAELLARLEAAEPQIADIVRLRVFLGFSVEATADALAISPPHGEATFRLRPHLVLCPPHRGAADGHRQRLTLSIPPG